MAFDRQLASVRAAFRSEADRQTAERLRLFAETGQQLAEAAERRHKAEVAGQIHELKQQEERIVAEINSKLSPAFRAFYFRFLSFKKYLR